MCLPIWPSLSLDQSLCRHRQPQLLPSLPHTHLDLPCLPSHYLRLQFLHSVGFWLTSFERPIFYYVRLRDEQVAPWKRFQIDSNPCNRCWSLLPGASYPPPNGSNPKLPQRPDYQHSNVSKQTKKADSHVTRPGDKAPRRKVLRWAGARKLLRPGQALYRPRQGPWIRQGIHSTAADRHFWQFPPRSTQWRPRNQRW